MFPLFHNGGVYLSSNALSNIMYTNSSSQFPHLVNGEIYSGDAECSMFEWRSLLLTYLGHAILGQLKKVHFAIPITYGEFEIYEERSVRSNR